MSATAANKSRYRGFIDRVINAKDYAVVDEIIHRDAVCHDPFPGQPRGAAGVKDTFKRFHAAFPDLRARIEDLIAEEDKVVARCTISGTHLGEFLGRVPTGRTVRYAEIAVVRFRDGQVVEHWAIADTLGLMQQLDAAASDSPLSPPAASGPR